MKLSRILRVVLPLLLWAMLLSPLPAADSKTVMVYYMPWYVAKPKSETWGWHWTMNHFNPELLNASGERQIASWYYPLIGPYDSSDPAVLEYHVLLMKLAGIDGVIVDWYGTDDFLDYAINNRATAELFHYTRKAGLKFSLCYEDQTLRHLIDGKVLAETNALAHAQSEMLYLQTNYFSDPTFLRWGHRPVLLNFGPQYFRDNSDWQAIFSVLSPTNQPAFFTEDDRLATGAGAFSWPPMWMSQAPGTGGVLSGAALKSYLTTFEQKASVWPAFISSAFPRFHDIYQRAGYRDYWGYLGDHGGGTLNETLTRAVTNASTIVQIVTWNDFGEGTVIEPTVENGYTDLKIIQNLRRQYLDTSFAYKTNDLTLPLRLFNLRRQNGGNPTVAAKLDGVFSNIVSGRLTEADGKLTELEATPFKSSQP